MGGRALEARLVCHPHTVKCYKRCEQKEHGSDSTDDYFKP